MSRGEPSFRLVRAALIPLVAISLATACGGGGRAPIAPDTGIGGGGGSTALAGSFSPSSASPGPDEVALAAGAGSSGDLVDVRVDVAGVADVFGASFDVVYDAQAATFVNWSPGTLLETGGSGVQYQVSNVTPGLVVVGATRTGGAAGGVDATGAVPAIHLFFRVRQPGTTSLAFRNADLLDGQSPPQTVPGLSWSGGTLVAN